MTKLVIEPYKYQLEDMKFLIHNKKGALLHEPGVGKTLGALLALTWVLESEGGQALVIVPSILIDTWYDKLYSYFDTDLKALMYKGTLFERKKMFLGAHDIVICSYDILQRDYDILSKIPWKVVISDETRYIKIGEVKRSRKTGRMNKFGCVQALAHRAKYVILMNGTPVTKSPMDVFHIIQLLNPNIYVSKKYFLRYHAVYRKQDGFPVISGWRKLGILKDAIDKISRRLIKSEVLELPEKQLIIKQFSLSKKHQKRLKELWEFGFLELKEDNIFLEGMALLMTVRRAMMDTSLLDLKEDSTYFEVLINLIEEIGDEQIIIYTHFHSTVDLLKTKLKQYKIGELHGRVTNKEVVVKGFKNNDFQILIANPKSAGVGLDFQQCHNVIFFELDYTPDDFWQGIDRTHRPGQTENVNIFVLLAKATPAIALFRSVIENIDYVKQILAGKEDASTLFEDKITLAEELRWKKL